MEHRERNKARCQQELVRERIEQRPQSCPLIKLTREVAINRIRKPGKEQCQQSESIGAIGHKTYEHRNQENAKDGQTIGDIHGVELGHASDLMRRGIIVTDGELVNELQVRRDTSYNWTDGLLSQPTAKGYGSMSTLPLLFKKEGLVEKHQVEGMDPSDRYFNRAILVNRTSAGYSTKVMYEALIVESQSHSTILAAVKELVEKLQDFGFTRLRTRPNFKGTRYLAEKETWIDYPDRS
jgi:hypothetical protein